MDKCSFFIKDKALFGGFPTNEEVKELEDLGVVCFIDLTFSTERRITKYDHRSRYINYPIPDRKVPTNIDSFSTFILTICSIIELLDDGELIYLHCKGGHGRSGLVVACILCQMYKYIPQYGIYMTNEFHKKRKIMKERWRILGSPQTIPQKLFVEKMFSSYYLSDNKSADPLSNFSLYKIKIDNVGKFHNIEAAYQAHKDINNKEYIKELTESVDPFYAKTLGESGEKPENWEKINYDIMRDILTKKLEQHKDVKKALSNTFLRPIVYENSPMTAKILTELREIYYLN